MLLVTVARALSCAISTVIGMLPYDDDREDDDLPPLSEEDIYIALDRMFGPDATKLYNRKWQYLSTNAVGPEMDNYTVGWEELFYRAHSKLWAHFNSTNIYIDHMQEPRYTPSHKIQQILNASFKQLENGPQLPLDIGRSGQNTSYGGVTFTRPYEIITPPKRLDFIAARPANFKLEGLGFPDHLQKLFTDAENLPQAHVCQGVVNYTVNNKVVKVFTDPDQKFETQLLTVLSAHGAADLLALAHLDRRGFSDEQINQILGPPPTWLQQQ